MDLPLPLFGDIWLRLFLLISIEAPYFPLAPLSTLFMAELMRLLLSAAAATAAGQLVFHLLLLNITPFLELPSCLPVLMSISFVPNSITQAELLLLLLVLVATSLH